MRSVMLVITTALLFAASGCVHHNLAKNGSSSSGHGGHAGLSGHPHGGGRHAGGRHAGGGHAGGGPYPGGAGAGLASASRNVAPSPVARLGHGYFGSGQPGPPTGTVAYPYYTVRAPRDFLMDNPPSIGY